MLVAVSAETLSTSLERRDGTLYTVVPRAVECDP
jgi:hypothetical protein